MKCDRSVFFRLGVLWLISLTLMYLSQCAFGNPWAIGSIEDAGKQKSSEATAAHAMKLLSLTEKDVLAEVGCGDATHLIAAVKKYKCHGLGIEIDAQLAQQARRNVEKAGLQKQIEIITGDARRVDLSDVTAIYVYLFPDLLKALAAKFKGKRVASAFHKIDGLSDGTKDADIWLYITKTKTSNRYLVSESWCRYCPAAEKAFLEAGHPKENIITIAEAERRFRFEVPHLPYEFDAPTSSTTKQVQQRSATWHGQRYYAPVCNNRNCAMCNSIRRQLRR